MNRRRGRGGGHWHPTLLLQAVPAARAYRCCACRIPRGPTMRLQQFRKLCPETAFSGRAGLAAAVTGHNHADSHRDLGLVLGPFQPVVLLLRGDQLEHLLAVLVGAVPEGHGVNLTVGFPGHLSGLSARLRRHSCTPPVCAHLQAAMPLDAKRQYRRVQTGSSIRSAVSFHAGSCFVILLQMRPHVLNQADRVVRQDGSHPSDLSSFNRLINSEINDLRLAHHTDSGSSCVGAVPVRAARDAPAIMILSKGCEARVNGLPYWSRSGSVDSSGQGKPNAIRGFRRFIGTRPSSHRCGRMVSR